MRFAALIVAGGRGDRAGGGLPKQFRALLGRPVLAWSVEAFANAGASDIIIAADPTHHDLCRAACGAASVRIVAGGATRTASVRAGLAAVADADFVMIHDAARPGLSPGMVGALRAAVEAGANGVAPALPISDSVRTVDAANIVVSETERAGLMRVQTPQAFRLDAIRRAYASLPLEAEMSDDIAVARAIGVDTMLIPGDQRLMKLTYAEDFEMAERLLAKARIVCVGHGIDAHRFSEGDHVTLCGVQIPHTKGLLGHSDADAGWHALVDAILGALGEGDIGAHFPPSDPQWKGADSERFLRHALALAERAGARIMHVDVTLVCERPKIGPHREAMRARTAEVLGLPLSRVSVKATTTERMGFLGREEGLAAQATATLDRPA
jgi:2-C-methyl-D-erythritol 4-phosphate cytidylyltransferase/2-C-methyl-D-erythritol 2,4-cyclodiphosphate synthase